MPTLSTADLIIAVGSVDGVLTTAAVKRLIGCGDVEVLFTQAFQVDRLPVDEWSGRRVILVDLAVNNREPVMTATFVRRLIEGGNILVAIIDEHDATAWRQALESAFAQMGDQVPELSAIDVLDGLAVRPKSQVDGGPGSSGEVLRRAMVAAGESVGGYVADMLAQADQADSGNFTSPLAGLANSATKSAIADNGRRVRLVNLLAQGVDVAFGDDQVQAWVAEYEEMEANLATLLDAVVEDLGDGIVRVDTGGCRVDVTSLLFALYKRGKVAVVAGTTAFNPAAGRPMPTVSIATSDRSFDLLAVVKAAGISTGGFAQKANIDPADEAAAIAVIRAALTV